MSKTLRTASFLSLTLGLSLMAGAAVKAETVAATDVGPSPMGLLASLEASQMSPTIQKETGECEDSDGDGECDTNASDE